MNVINKIEEIKDTISTKIIGTKKLFSQYDLKSPTHNIVHVSCNDFTYFVDKSICKYLTTIDIRNHGLDLALIFETNISFSYFPLDILFGEKIHELIFEYDAIDCKFKLTGLVTIVSYYYKRSWEKYNIKIRHAYEKIKKINENINYYTYGLI